LVNRFEVESIAVAVHDCKHIIKEIETKIFKLVNSPIFDSGIASIPNNVMTLSSELCWWKQSPICEDSCH